MDRNSNPEAPVQSTSTGPMMEMEVVTPAMEMLPEPSHGTDTAVRVGIEMDTTPVTPGYQDEGDGSVPAYDLPTNASEAGQRISACFEYVRTTAGESLQKLLNASGKQLELHPKNALQVLKIALSVQGEDIRNSLKEVKDAISRWEVHEHEPENFDFDPASHFLHVFSMASARIVMQSEDAVRWAIEAAEFQANAANTDVEHARAAAEASVRSPFIRPVALVIVEVYMQLIMIHVNAYCNAYKVEVGLRRKALTTILPRALKQKMNNRKTARISDMAQRRTMAAFVSLINFTIAALFPEV